jgi:multidrug efflux system membrane fusion protein
VSKALAAGPVGVDAFGPDNQTVIAHGNLLVIDNQIDQATGTIKLKAEFANNDLALWPGQFVNVRVLVDTLRQVIVAPTAAVQRGPNGPFVFAVGEDNKVTVHLVRVTQQDETQSVIASGVAAGDRVVTTGFNQLSDGSRVTIGSAAEVPASARPRDGRPDRQRRRGSDGTAQSSPTSRGDSQRRTERDATSQTP